MSDEWREHTMQMPPRPPPLGLIVAISENRCIGVDGKLPWHIAEDLRHFKQITTGHAVIMGRKTHESVGRPLPKRRNIVISRQAGLEIEGCEVAGSIQDAIALARGTDAMPMIIGGASIYAEALPMVSKIHLTEVHRKVDGDTFFPELVSKEWDEVDRRVCGDGSCTFVTLERKR